MDELLRTLRRRKGLIALIVLAFTLASLVIVSIIPTIYTAEAVVMLEAPVGAPLDGSEQTRMSTLVELLRSRALLREVAKRLSLLDAPPQPSTAVSEPSWLRVGLGWISSHVAAFRTDDDPLLNRAEQAQAADQQAAKRAQEDAIVDQLLDRVSVSQVGNSRLITVAATSTSPAMAALLANTVVNTQIDIERAEENADDKQNVASLTKQIDELRPSLRASDLAIAEYMRVHNLASSNSSSDQSILLGSTLSEFNDAKNPQIPPVRGTIASSELLSQLRSQEAELSAHLAELQGYYGPDYPEIVSTQAKLDDVRQRIADEIAGINKDLSKQFSAISGLKELQRDAEIKQQLYSSVLSQLQDAQRKADVAHSDISVVSNASVLDAASHSSSDRIVGVAFLGSVLLGLIIAFALEVFDKYLRSAQQVASALGLPTLGMVPELSRAKLSRSIQSLINDEPRSSFAEAIRNIYVELVARQDDSRPRVVVVTSALDNEGKTTIAAALAAMATAHDRLAVAIELDHRRPSLGLSFKDRLVSLDVDGVLSEDLPVNLAALASSPRFPTLLDELRKRFELIIFDVPPILKARDAKALASFADANILVLQWGKTPPSAARAAREILGDHNTVVVLNRVDYKDHARRGYGDDIQYLAAHA